MKADAASAARDLAGSTIAIAESRELDLFAGLLERRGALVLRCPLIAITDAPDPAPVLAWIEAFNRGACDDLILMTGEGLRRLLSCIERHAPGLRGPFLDRLAAVRCIVRGPKPARALRELGLRPDCTADPATTAGVIQSLHDEDLRGRRVGVQLYGDDPNRPLIDFLRTRGATPLPVAPYVYADAADEARVLDLVDRLAVGRVDVIAFTSEAQVERLFRVAIRAGRERELLNGLHRALLAAIGPVATAALTRRGLPVPVQPAGRYALKPLATAIADALASRPAGQRASG